MSVVSNTLINSGILFFECIKQKRTVTEYMYIHHMVAIATDLWYLIAGFTVLGPSLLQEYNGYRYRRKLSNSLLPDGSSKIIGRDISFS